MKWVYTVWDYTNSELIIFNNKKSQKKCCNIKKKEYNQIVVFYKINRRKMSGLTVLQTKLINAWLTVKRFSELADKQPKLFSKVLNVKIDDYFMIWFEINRDTVENKWIENRIEKWDDEKEAIESLNSCQFQEYAYEKCLDWLDL